MGLASAFSTALTGMSAAETSIDVIGNNLANSNTVGFKASTATFATQFSQTQTLGSAATATTAAPIPPRSAWARWSPRSRRISARAPSRPVPTPSDLAIQGNGMFVMQGAGGEQLYTRDGEFQLNANNANWSTPAATTCWATASTTSFNINTSTLAPLSIPLGTATVAAGDARTWSLQGSLTPTGTIANTASILETGVLGDAQYTRPATAATAANNAPPARSPPAPIPILRDLCPRSGGGEPSQPHQPAHQRGGQQRRSK